MAGAVYLKWFNTQVFSVEFHLMIEDDIPLKYGIAPGLPSKKYIVSCLESRHNPLNVNLLKDCLN